MTLHCHNRRLIFKMARMWLIAFCCILVFGLECHVLMRTSQLYYFIDLCLKHDDVIKWKHFPRYWPFYAGNSPVSGEFPAQRPVTRSFDAFLICAWINAWVNNREAGDLRRYRAHYDVTVMSNDGSVSVMWSRLLIVDKLLTRFEFHQRQKCDIKKLVWRVCQKLCVPHRKM